MNESASEHAQTTTAETRTQLKHVLFDVDFLHKPTVKGFRAKFGWLGIPWLFEMYALMSRATNARVDPSVALLTASDMGLTDGQKMIDHCVENGLFELERGALTSRRVANDQESLHKKQERWRKQRDSSAATALQPRCANAEAARKSEDTEVLNTEDLNRSKETVLIPIPADFPNEVIDAVERWAFYLKRKWNRELDEIQRETLLMNWAARPKNELIAGINQSIEKGYRKIVYEPPDERPQRGSAKQKETTTDAIARVMNFEVRTIGTK